MDHDAVLRARVLLIGSGRLGLLQKVGAYRVLAEVSPAAYRPKLSRALVGLSYGSTLRDRPEIRRRVVEEAVAAARGLDQADPMRARALLHALDAHQELLYGLGQPSAGLAVREEMRSIRRPNGAVGDGSEAGHGIWAVGLAEDGRHDEAAEALAEVVRADRARAARTRTSAWALVSWAAQLEAAGRHDDAVQAVAELVALQREAAAGAEGEQMALLFHSLVHLARLLDADGRQDEAAATWQEAAALLTDLTDLTDLAESRDRASWSGEQPSFWSALLALSGGADERPAPGEPGPHLGAPPADWSPDVRKRYHEGRTALEDAVSSLLPSAEADPGRHLAALVTLQRRLLIRTAVHAETSRPRALESVRPLFDEAVGLARRLHTLSPSDGTPALVRALIDRSTLLVAGLRPGDALADLRQAVDLMAQPAV